jgi:hypothetical protein
VPGDRRTTTPTGTGQACRMARHYGIEIKNLSFPAVREAVEAYVKS